MLEEIRSHFKKTARMIDRTYKEHKRPLTDDDLAQFQNGDVENVYFLRIGDLNNISGGDDHLEDQIVINMRIYGFGKNSDNENYDKFYCKALRIRSQAVKVDFLEPDGFIKKVIARGLRPQTKQGSEDFFIYDMDFIIRVSQGL